jgi:hypothetical protein
MSDRQIGSVEVTASGRARVRLTLPGIGRKTVDAFDTEAEAHAYRREMVRILSREAPDDGVTLGALSLGRQMQIPTLR